MEEVQPEELEELVRELEGESDAEESISPEIESLLRDLQPARRFTARLRAARQLGEVSSSSRHTNHPVAHDRGRGQASPARPSSTDSLAERETHPSPQGAARDA